MSKKCTPNEFSKFFYALKIVLPKFAPDITNSDVVKAWYDGLSDMSIDQLREAYVFFRDNVDQFPTIRQIRLFGDKKPLPSEALEAVIERNAAEFRRWEQKYLGRDDGEKNDLLC